MLEGLMKTHMASLFYLLLSPTYFYPVSARKYGAMGDSYASGDGAGSSKWLPNFDPGCGRFSDAYPVQVAKNDELDIGESSFRNLACGGASTTSVLLLQAPRVADSEIVTLTVGGNQVDFFTLLNECVHQWRPSSTCEEEMIKSRRLVQSTEFIGNYDKLLKELVQYLAPGARLLVTGYATFFNENTDQCNRVSFSTTNPENSLTMELRRRFNDLVRMLNDVIKAVTVAHGVEFIDMDEIFEGHRFCEEGVEEPNSSRAETWFFNLNYEPDSQELFLRNRDFEQTRFPKPIEDFFNLTKVFHPTSLGHKGIADAIVRQVLLEV